MLPIPRFNDPKAFRWAKSFLIESFHIHKLCAPFNRNRHFKPKERGRERRRKKNGYYFSYCWYPHSRGRFSPSQSDNENGILDLGERKMGKGRKKGRKKKYHRRKSLFFSRTDIWRKSIQRKIKGKLIMVTLFASFSSLREVSGSNTNWHITYTEDWEECEDSLNLPFHLSLLSNFECAFLGWKYHCNEGDASRDVHNGKFLCFDIFSSFLRTLTFLGKWLSPWPILVRVLCLYLDNTSSCSFVT